MFQASLQQGNKSRINLPVTLETRLFFVATQASAHTSYTEKTFFDKQTASSFITAGEVKIHPFNLHIKRERQKDV